MDIAYLYLSIVVAVPSFFIALALDKELHLEHPESKSFKWGYFLGLTGLLGGLATTGFLFYNTPHKFTFEFAIVGSIFSIIYALVSIFVLKRSLVALIIQTIMSLNILIWIINIFYIKNRSNELSKPYILISIKGASKLTRTLIGANIFWIVSSIIFILLFEPFGKYPEEKLIVSIVLFFPMISLIGYFIYKLIIEDK